MLAANYSNVRENLKDYCDRVVDDNETVIVTRKNEKNVVIADYKAGHVITKTLDELKAMEDE